MPKAKTKTDGPQEDTTSPKKVDNKSPKQDGDKKTPARKTGTVTGLLRAAAARIPPAGTRRSVLGLHDANSYSLPADFLNCSDEMKDCLSTDYDDECDNVGPPQPFQYEDLDEPDYEDQENVDHHHDEALDDMEGDGEDIDYDNMDAFDVENMGAGDGAAGFNPGLEFAEVLAEQGETEGPPVPGDIAKLVNKIWSTLQRNLNSVYTAHPRPQNLKTYKVDVNEELVPTLKKFTRSRDMRLRSVQGAIAAATNVQVKNLDQLAKLESASEQETATYLTRIVRGSVSAIKLLSHANMVVNNSRRELLKAVINGKYHGLCKASTTLDSNKLFGNNLTDRLKCLGQASRIGRHFGGFGRGGSRRYHPYRYNNNNNKSNFLGESTVSKQHENVSGFSLQGIAKTNWQNRAKHAYSKMIKANTHVNVYPPFRPGQGPRRIQTRQGPEERPVVDPPTEQAQDMVGEFNLPVMDINRWPVFMAGRASTRLSEWQHLTADRIILRHIKGLTIDFINLPQQTWVPRPLKLTGNERQYLRNEIQNLLQMQVIEKTTHSDGEFISSIFLRPKKQAGKYRLILNLKNLNVEVEYHKFKMDTLDTALKLVTQGCFMISIDIKDAYYTIKIDEQYRKYLRFEFEGQLYQFRVLPNGLSSGPRIFTKILKVPLTHLRQTYGINTSAYIDDLFLSEDSPQQCHLAATKMVDLLQNLGFTISPKSVLVPAQVIEHVGFVIDSVNMKVSLPVDKVTDITEYIQKCLRKESLTIRDVAQLLGKLEATKPGNRFAQLYTKTLTWEKNAALAKNGYNFDAKMKLSQKVRNELSWWLQNLASVSAEIFTGQPNDTIFTDASNDGWGCHAPSFGDKFGGRWNDDEKQYHINVLELLAILYSLRALDRHLHDMHLRIMTDNTTAMLCIRNQGSVHSWQCDNVTRQIWELAIDRNLWLSTAHIPGVLNVEADTASRKFVDDTEWTLNDNIFADICTKLGRPTMDLFASRLNTKLQHFCSWQPDPEATHIDAFSIPWTGFLGYAFPPFAVLPAVMQKIRLEGAQVIVVVPKWPTKPWYTMMQKMIISEVFEFPVTHDTLFLSSRVMTHKVDTRGQHPLTGQLTLMAVKLSGM